MERLVLPAVIVSLSAGALWLVRRRRRSALPPSAVAIAEPPAQSPPGEMRPLLCPTCGGQYPPGLRFCPLDARALVMNSEWSMGAPAQLACRACSRTFEPTTRFCPFDAQELVPAPGAPVAAPPVARAGARGGRICPRCTERYTGGERFCGRDGTELVTLN